MMPAKAALMTEVTGQEESLLAEPLPGKGYVVHSLKRRSSSIKTQQMDHLDEDPHVENVNFFLH
jgi:GDPmannose 4,6-dehydratase